MNEPQVATLAEIEATWNMDDITDANAILDYRAHDAKLKALEKPKDRKTQG